MRGTVFVWRVADIGTPIGKFFKILSKKYRYSVVNATVNAVPFPNSLFKERFRPAFSQCLRTIGSPNPNPPFSVPRRR